MYTNVDRAFHVANANVDDLFDEVAYFLFFQVLRVVFV